MGRAHRYDVWNSGEAYEAYVGRWSRLVAREFVTWLDVPAGSRWLDVGCGTGALSETILDLCSPDSVTGIDPSQGFISHARGQVTGAEFQVAGAEQMPFEEAAFDASVAGLVLNFVAAPGQAAAEMARVTRPQGTIGAYVWDYGGRMEFMRHFWDAAALVDEDSVYLDEGARFPLCRPQSLRELFKQSGVVETDVAAIDIPTEFRSFADYWRPFLGGQGAAPGYLMSLSEERREALRRRLAEKVPREGDGSIKLIARAWAVRGRKG